MPLRGARRRTRRAEGAVEAVVTDNDGEFLDQYELDEAFEA